MSLLTRADALLQAIPKVDQLKKDDHAARQIRAKATELRESRNEYGSYQAQGGVLDPKVCPDAQRVRKTIALAEAYRDQLVSPTGGANGWVELKRSLTALIKDVKEGVTQGIENTTKPLSKAYKDLESKKGVARALGRESDYLALSNELAALRAKDWKTLASAELSAAIQRAKKFLAGWEKLGLVDLPEAVEKFLAQVHANGAPLGDFEAEGVRGWLDKKKLLNKIRIIFRE